MDRPSLSVSFRSGQLDFILPLTSELNTFKVHLKDKDEHTERLSKEFSLLHQISDKILHTSCCLQILEGYPTALSSERERANS